MKKVLILTHFDTSASSGGDIVRMKRIALLISSRYKVKISGFPGYFPDIHPTKLIRFLPCWVTLISREIFSDRFEWIYIVNDPCLVILSYFLKKVSSRKYKIVYDVCLTPWLMRRMKLKAVVRHLLDLLALSFSRLIITTSERGKILLRRFEKKVLVVPNFVDTENFQSSRDTRFAARQKYGFGPEVKVVGLIGPFDNMYNRPFLTFLRENISKFDKRIRFLLIGRYDRRDFFEAENVIWAGHVQDYLIHLSALDCLIIPRTIPTEGAMNKALEAMSMEILVFTTPVGYTNLEYMTPGEQLFVYPIENLPEAINRLIFNADLLTKIGQKARHQIERYYSMKSMGQKLLESLEQT